MKKLLFFIILFYSALSVIAQDFTDYYTMETEDTIELDITNYDFHERFYTIYNIFKDDRFVISEGRAYGLFKISSKQNFSLFLSDLHKDFSALTKYELDDLFEIEKEALPQSFITSILFDISVKTTYATTDNDHCIDSEPFCTSDIITFEASHSQNEAEPVPDKACLGNTYNPSWFYMKIDTPGQFIIHMEGVDPDNSSTQRDIDFCIWGPFTDPTSPCVSMLDTQHVIDCSYSGSYSENVYLGYTNHGNHNHGTYTNHTPEAGEYYILLITNYSRQPCMITFTKQENSGPGTTDCSIMPPLVWYENPCHGGTLTLHAQEISGATYSWTGPNGFTSTQIHPTITNVTVNNTGTYQCSITVGGSTSDPMSIVVDIIPQLVVDFSTSTSLCAGSEISFTGNVTTTPAGHDNVITEWEKTWDFGDGSNPESGANATHVYNAPGTYTVTYTVRASNYAGASCENIKTKTITVHAIPEAEAGQNQNVNFNNPATLTATAVSGASYMWQPAEKINGNPAMQSVQTVPLTETTTFTLTVTKNGCSDQDEVTIGVGDAMTVSATIADAEICEGNSTTASVSAMGGNGSYNYSWEASGPAEFSNPHAASTSIHPLESGEYVIACVINDGQTTVRKEMICYVNPAEDDIHTIAVCPSELPYILELPDGSTVSFNEETGPNGWHQTVQNQYGCNVNVALYLTINDIVENTFNVETCNEPYTFVDNGNVIIMLENTCVFDTIYPFGDCQKHVTINFTRNDTYDENYAGEYVSDNYPEHQCDRYTWSNGMTYDTHGDFQWTFQSVSGCDSIVTLHLNEDNLSFTVEGEQPTETFDTCKNNDGYFLWGTELLGKRIYYGDTITGSIYDHLFAGASYEGCDSIGYINIKLYSQPHVNREIGGDEFVEPGLGFMPYIYEYTIEGLFGAGVENDHPAEYSWELFCYYDTPNRLYPNIEDNYESTWIVNPENDNSKALVYVNEEGNALLVCKIQTLCGTIRSQRFIYTEGYKDGYSVDEHDYDNMVNIFPNPSQGELYIGYSDLLGETPLIISIYNYNGMLIDQFHSNTNNNVTEYSTYGLANGIYFVRIAGNDFAVTKKFVLNR